MHERDTCNSAGYIFIKCHDFQDEKIETLPRLGGETSASGESSVFLTLSSTFNGSSILIKAAFNYLDTERASCVFHRFSSKTEETI